MARIIFIFCLLLFIFLSACKKQGEKNKVPLDQLNIDHTNDYKYIFKGDLEKEKKREQRYKKDIFRE